MLPAEFIPVDGVSEAELAEAVLLSSLADETPEGRSIVALAQERYGLDPDRHLDGAELRVDVRPTQQAEPAAADMAGTASTDESDATARISLRLSEALKAQIEAAARNRSVSVNSWLVQAATAALAEPASHGWGRSWTAGPAHRVTGWING